MTLFWILAGYVYKLEVCYKLEVFTEYLENVLLKTLWVLITWRYLWIFQNFLKRTGNVFRRGKCFSFLFPGRNCKFFPNVAKWCLLKTNEFQLRLRIFENILKLAFEKAVNKVVVPNKVANIWNGWKLMENNKEFVTMSIINNKVNNSATWMGKRYMLLFSV